MNWKYNKPSLKFYRRKLRNDSTEYELMLWKSIRRRQLLGYKFIRQYSVLNYILDFYCPKARLGIELDGEYHLDAEQKKHDEIRTIYIEDLHIKVIRFQNWEVKYNIENVLETIAYYL